MLTRHGPLQDSKKVLMPGIQADIFCPSVQGIVDGMPQEQDPDQTITPYLPSSDPALSSFVGLHGHGLFFSRRSVPLHIS